MKDGRGKARKRRGNLREYPKKEKKKGKTSSMAELRRVVVYRTQGQGWKRDINAEQRMARGARDQSDGVAV